MEEELFHKAVHAATMIASQVKSEDMDKPTPCSEWNVRELFNHMANELAWIEPLLSGKTIEEVGTSLDGDLLGDDPIGSWHKYAKASMDAAMATAPDKMIKLSYGEKSAKGYVNEVGGDVLVHAWDLAKAIGAEFMLDDDMANDVMEATKDIMPMARNGGMIGPELTPKGVSGLSKLLAYFGRDEAWIAPATI